MLLRLLNYCMHVRMYENLKLNETNMDLSPLKWLFEKINNYSFQNTEIFFSSCYSVPLKKCTIGNI